MRKRDEGGGKREKNWRQRKRNEEREREREGGNRTQFPKSPTQRKELGVRLPKDGQR